jgi:hypothetical protein
VDPTGEVSISGQYRHWEDATLRDCANDDLRQIARIADTGCTTIAYDTEAKRFKVFK